MGVDEPGDPRNRHPISRRRFLASGVAGTAGLWIDLSIPRTAGADSTGTAAASRQSLSASEWKTVEAIAGRIIPSDETPGALEASCVTFIDRSLAEEDAAALPLYQAALAALDELCLGRWGAPFTAASPERQDAVLHELEAGDVAGWKARAAAPAAFFATVRIHTILGFVLDPRYGGNRDYIGWKTMGFPGPVHHLGGSRPEQMIGEASFVPIWERKGGAGHGSKGDGSKGDSSKGHA